MSKERERINVGTKTGKTREITTCLCFLPGRYSSVYTSTAYTGNEGVTKHLPHRYQGHSHTASVHTAGSPGHVRFSRWLSLLPRKDTEHY